MKRITLAIMIAAAASATAQTPPAPPAPARPAPEPMPAPRATPMPTPGPVWIGNLDDYREFAREANRDALEAQRATLAAQRETLREARDFTNFAPVTVGIGQGIGAGVSYSGAMVVGSDGFSRRTPPPAWAHGDPADSVYQVAREVLTRGEWGQAARMFSDLQKSYPKSVYITEAQYWEAYARYKIGTTDELHQAAKVLEPLVGKTVTTTEVRNGMSYSFNGNTMSVPFGRGGRTNDNDVTTLYARINGALAMRGDRDAAAKVEKAAATPGAPCDQDEISLRTEALNALSQSDPSQALPIIRKVLEHKDDCSAQLRRNALFMLTRRSDAESTNLLISEAKAEPNANVRADAIGFLTRIPGDAGVNALEDILRTEQDERVQRSAVRALMSSDNPKARASMRALIDRKDAPVNLRIEAIRSYNSERATADDAAYLRGLYGKADSESLKGAIVDAVARIGGPDNDQWLLALVRNSNESSSIRSRALGAFTRSPTVTVADLIKLYDSSSESYELRMRIVNMLGNRKEPEATDKLLDIVKTSTVLDVRKQAINALINKKDPRANQLLMDILDGKK